MLTRNYLLVLALLLSATACAKQPVADEVAAPSAVTQSEAAASDAVAAEQVKIVEPAKETQKEAPVTDAGTGITLQNAGKVETIYFDYDSFVLTADAQQILEKNAQILRSNTAEKIVIKGHTDERGSDAYNLALGEKRARTTFNFLVTLGIPADRLSIISYGEEQPVAAGQDEATWAQNRRAEF